MKNIMLLVVIAVVATLAYTVWPTMYRLEIYNLYDKKFTIRINRFTQKTEILTPEGWWAMEQPRLIDDLGLLDHLSIQYLQETTPSRCSWTWISGRRGLRCGN